jgi:hypothetical protein
LRRQSLRNTIRSLRSETTDLASPLELENPGIDIQVLIKQPLAQLGVMPVQRATPHMGFYRLGTRLVLPTRPSP